MEEETLLIVGNGFDLSMGFKTSYGDFMQSSFYPKNNSTLCSYLLKEYRANMGWIDIENELSKYSKLLSSFELKSEQDELKWGVAAFRKQYEDLKLSLKTYLYP